jgi:hypothetical protein
MLEEQELLIAGLLSSVPQKRSAQTEIDEAMKATLLVMLR